MAQLAEQLICNQQVIGSSPIIGLISIEIINFISRDGAVWKLVGLITRRSQVQILPPQFFVRTLSMLTDGHAQIAQLVEQRTENPRVVGSIPTEGTIRGFSSSGRAPPCQGGGSEFEPRNPLHTAT